MTSITMGNSSALEQCLLFTKHKTCTHTLYIWRDSEVPIACPACRAALARLGVVLVRTRLRRWSALDAETEEVRDRPLTAVVAMALVQDRRRSRQRMHRRQAGGPDERERACRSRERTARNMASDRRLLP